MIRQFLSKSRQKMRNAYYGFHPHVIDCCVRNKTISLKVSSWIEKFRADTYETKEPETLDWLDAELKDDDILFDIGANIGVYSLYAAALNSKCRIFSFEPEAQNFSHLCQNIYRNGFLNITPCNVALSSKEHFDYFHVTQMVAGSAFHSLYRPSPHQKGGAVSVLRQGALCASLDGLINHHGLPCPTLLKLDVDGIEHEIIQGAKNALQSGKIRSLLVELNGDKRSGPVADILIFLKNAGYKVVHQGKEGITGTGEINANFIFQLI